MKALILTDHSNHSNENSLYELSRELFSHKAIEKVDVASRKTESNVPFFSCRNVTDIYTTNVDSSFCFDATNHPLESNINQNLLSEYDFVWLRLPPPLSKEFLDYLEIAFSGSVIVNSPRAIYETGSKAFLMNFEEVCPPMKICESLDDILDFGRKFPIVLKPFREYGGKGILKIDGDRVSNGKASFTLQEFTDNYKNAPTNYLAVKYLENVKQGDKRIVVIDGKIMGASLRLPPENSWICNVSMGGTPNYSEVSLEEIEMVNFINPLLSAKGIVMYGVDTLVDDNNRRVLSEINTTSIGGLPQIAKLTNRTLVERGIDLIVKCVLNRLK
jgi:glutathione synthase